MQSENRTVSNTQNILIATSDSEWGKETRTKLLSLGFDCQYVREGKECQHSVYKGQFSTVILDPDLENHSGVEVLKYLKANFPALRVVLVFPDQKRSDNYKELRSDLKSVGVSQTFTRPIAIKSIVDYLTGEGNSGVKDKDCTKVDIGSFLTGKPANFDYYIRLKENHFVKLFKKGETIHFERVNKYLSDGVKYFYFLTIERRNYINDLNDVMKVGLASGPADNKLMLSQIKNVSEKFMEEIDTRGLEPDLVEMSKAISENVFRFIKQSSSLRKIMEDFRVFHPEEYTHSFLVAFFASVICKNLDWVGRRTLEAVTLGAYLHDVGLMKIPASLRDRAPSTFTPAELEIYRTHPRLGAEMLSNIPDINYQVVQIVYQHHERLHGGGYPNKLSDLRIYPLAKIVALADDFSELLVQSGVSPIEGIKLFLKDRERLLSFDQTVIRALVRGFIRDEVTA